MGRHLSDKKLAEIIKNIYREGYLKATPSANFDQLAESAPYQVSPDGKRQKFIDYKHYNIDEKIYDEIVKRHIKENNLNKACAETVRFHAYLGCGPNLIENDLI